MRLLTCAVLAFSLTGCGIISRPVVSTPPARCASLVPDSWAGGVEAAPVPATADLSLLDQVKAWAGAYVAQGGQLAKANGRTADTIEIVSKCEDLVNASRADRQ